MLTNFKSKVIKDSFISSFFLGMNLFINFFTTVFVSRILSPKDYGVIALIVVFTSFISMFIDSGLSFSIMRSDNNNRFILIMDNMSFYIGLGLTIFTCFLAWPISNFYKLSTLFFPALALSINFVLISLYTVHLAFLKKIGAYTSIGFISLFATIISSFILFGLSLFGFKYWAIILSQIMLNIILMLLYRRASKLKFQFVSYKYLIFGFRKVKVLMGTINIFNLLNYWARNVDNLVVGKYFGPETLGIYNRAYNLFMIPLSIFQNVFHSVFFPNLVLIKKDKKNLQMEILLVLKIVGIISTLLAGSLILFPKQIVLTFWGENWFEVSSYLPYFGVLIYTQSIITVFSNLFIVYEKEKQFAFFSTISSIIAILTILVGAYFSMFIMILFYTLGSVLIIFPFFVFGGLFIVLKFSIRPFLMMLLPKVISFLVIIFAVFFNQYLIKIISIIFLGLIIAFDIWNLRKFVNYRKLFFIKKYYK